MNHFYKVKLYTKRFLGTEKTVVISHTIIALIIYILLVKLTIGFDIKRINYVYSSELGTISSILFGFMSSSFGFIISTKNNILDRLNTTGNIRVIYKVIFYALFNLLVCCIIYYFKSFFMMPDTNIILGIEKKLFITILHIGLFSFINALVLFMLTIYYLKKIFLPKI